MATTIRFSSIANKALPFPEDFRPFIGTELTCPNRDEVEIEALPEYTGESVMTRGFFRMVSNAGSAVVDRFFPNWKAKVSIEENRVAAEVLESFDNPAEDEPSGPKKEEDLVKSRKNKWSNANWWVMYSIAARENFPAPSDTASMRRTIHKWISEKMKENGVTLKERSEVIYRAVEWTFVPTEGEVTARKERNSDAILTRLALFNRSWWTYWWSPRRADTTTT